MNPERPLQPVVPLPPESPKEGNDGAVEAAKRLIDVPKEWGIQSASSEPTRGIVPIEDFKGDPRRVPGHPSNSNNDAIQAYRRSLSEEDKNQPQ